MNKHDLRAFNRTFPNGTRIYLAWIEDSKHAVFQKEIPNQTVWGGSTYGTIRVHIDDLTNGNFEYMIEHNLTRFD